jgi:hypothetical protein
MQKNIILFLLCKLSFCLYAIAQIKSPNGEYMPVKPMEGAIIMNLGDLMERWTADTLKATVTIP